MSAPANSGIKTSADGTAYIPASKRADGTTRKAIRVRPGFTPQEDIETYKSRTAEAWKNRGSGGVPGSEESNTTQNAPEGKSKNAKRREAAKRRQAAETAADSTPQHDKDLAETMDGIGLSPPALQKQEPQHLEASTDTASINNDSHVEQQKKIRNLLKKLGAVNDLKAKKASGEKLSHDQVMKIGREEELLRDLKKLNYEEPEASGEVSKAV